MKLQHTGLRFYTIHIILLLLVVACGGKQDADNKKQADTLPEDTIQASPKSDIKTWETYQSNEYGFSMKVPPGWKVSEHMVGRSMPVINFYPAEAGQLMELPLTVHVDARVSFVGVYPKGYGTDLPSGMSGRLNQVFANVADVEINNEESQAFMLENKDVWGFYIVPLNVPSDWENGFVFAQIRVLDFRTECYSSKSGKKIEMANCDPMMGDSIKRYGSLSAEHKQMVLNILQSLQFVQGKDSSEKAESQADKPESIQIKYPKPGQVVSSPIEIRGQARGQWFFEGEFGVKLLQGDNTIAEARAIAEGKWMTRDFVPFKASLEFEKPVNNKGDLFLVLTNSNPSGMPKNNKTYRIPIEVR